MTDTQHPGPPPLVVVPQSPSTQDPMDRARMHLHELRESLGLTQRALGKRLDVQQPAIAKMERRSDMYVSNLRAYVHALGGDLRFIAKFPDREVELFPPGSSPSGDGGSTR